mmetsp:Transcript_18185/g.20927  ORF Transcript_18185/g.20927 Transcript_18185/m.20927 type:complete len:106 (-) Transcript_18185:222-539(-)
MPDCFDSSMQNLALDDPEELNHFGKQSDADEAKETSQDNENSRMKTDDVSKHEQAKVIACIDRKDVVIKSIIRAMRKYYLDLLESLTGYKRKMRNIKKKHSLLID